MAIIVLLLFAVYAGAGGNKRLYDSHTGEVRGVTGVSLEVVEVVAERSESNGPVTFDTAVVYSNFHRFKFGNLRGQSLKTGLEIGRSLGNSSAIAIKLEHYYMLYHILGD